MDQIVGTERDGRLTLCLGCRATIAAGVCGVEWRKDERWNSEIGERGL